MKRDIFIYKSSYGSRSLALAVLLACGLSIACSREDNMFTEGRYPVIPTSEVRTIPQENGTENWTGEEQVAVQAVTSQDGWDKADVGIYNAASDGILSSSEPVWWKYSGESKKVRAWYCGDGSTAAKGANAAAVPSSWAVQADQSGEGYDASRFLFAPVREATFAVSRIVPLTFYHQTAKVVMNVNEGGYATSADLIQSVTIKDMALSGSFTVPADDGGTTGSWVADSEYKADVILHKLDSPEGTSLVSYAGYAIPQEMAGLQLSVITSAGEVSATIAEDEGLLTAGNAMTYSLTLTDESGLALSVEALKLEKEYSADQLKFGDYFYSDGTTSDGGLRGIYNNGTLKMEATKPGPAAGKTVVGIVFQTDPARIGEAEKDALGYTDGDAVGLAISLKNAAIDVSWGVAATDEAPENVPKHCDLYPHIDGLADYTAVIDAHKDDQSFAANYPVFTAVVNYNESCPVTGNTTGWFLPSIGQLWDMIYILGACTPLEDHVSSDTGTGWQVKFADADGYINSLNEWMSAVIDSNKDKFEAGSKQKIASSTERNANAMWYWKLNSETDLMIEGGTKQKASDDVLDVRPVIAFTIGSSSGSATPVEPAGPAE